jgi:maltose alpha-D-glucosyltransferase/alpha-amylase
VARPRLVKGTAGELEGSSGGRVRRTRRPEKGLVPAVIEGARGGSRVAYGERFGLTLMRRLEEGIHPDVEVSRFLTERASFPHALPILGTIEYRRRGRPAITLAVLRDAGGKQTDGLRHALDSLGRFFESVLAQGAGAPLPVPPNEGLLQLAARGVPPQARERIGPFLRDAELLGRRTAEMHRALASAADDAAFAPEPFSGLYQRALVQSLRVLIRECFQLVRRRLRDLDEGTRAAGQHLLSLEADITRRFRSELQRRIGAARIRCHGDYRLQRLLHTGKDFVIADFEGDPARPLSERRIKRSPLRDVASMIRSFHHAASQALSGRVGAAGVRAEDLPTLEPWARSWKTWVSAAFLESYLAAAAGAAFHPASREELAALFDAAYVETLLSELRHDLTLHPERARWPLAELLAVVERGKQP